MMVMRSWRHPRSPCKVEGCGQPAGPTGFCKTHRDSRAHYDRPVYTTELRQQDREAAREDVIGVPRSERSQQRAEELRIWYDTVVRPKL